MRQGAFTPKTRRLALERAGNVCEICGLSFTDKSRPEYHHIKPKRNGGDDTLDNCLVLCEYCHSSELGYILCHGLNAPPRAVFFEKNRAKAAMRAKFARAKAFKRLFGILKQDYRI